MGKREDNLRPWKKGQSGNPLGGKLHNKEIKKIKALTKKQLAEIGSVMLNGTVQDLDKLKKDKTQSVLKHMLASVAHNAVTNGDTNALETLLNRIIGKVKEEVFVESIDVTPEVITSFGDFCYNAGYPKPFDKQIEMKDFILNQDGVKMLLGARGYGKTEYITTLGVAYELYLHPRKSFLIMTKSESRNKLILREIARACETVGMYFESKNSEDLVLKGNVGINASVSAVTVLTCSLRGRHPDCVIFDDPVTPESSSPAHRDKLKIVYDEVVGKVCKNVGLIGQPVHADDLYANLEHSDVEIMKVPYNSIPSLDPDLELQRLAGVDPDSIDRSYFLRHPKAGGMAFDNLKYIDDYPNNGTSVAFIDPSFEGGDYTAMCIMQAYFEGIAVQGFAWKRAWNNCVEDIVKHCNDYNVARLAFETNSLGSMPIEILQGALGKTGVVGIKSNTNKHSRILSAGAFAHLIHMSKKSDKIYIDQTRKYEYSSKHDDCPDSLASCLVWLGLIRGK